MLNENIEIDWGSGQDTLFSGRGTTGRGRLE